jgi:hypothetical protein
MLIVHGGTPLEGEVTVRGAKNLVSKAMVAALLGTAAVCAVVTAACAILLVARRDAAAEMREIPGAGALAEGMWWVRTRPWGEPAVEFLVSLRPAWWIVRAGVVGVAIGSVTTTALGAVTFAAALAASIWLGRKSRADDVHGRGAVLVPAVNVGLAVGALIVCAALVSGARSSDIGYVSYEAGYHDGYNDSRYQPDSYYGTNGAIVDDGGLENIFAYGPDGELLHGVRLFDQAGNPIELDSFEGCYDEETDRMMPTAVSSPWGAHVYPRYSIEDDGYGNCTEPELNPPYGDRLPGMDQAEPESAEPGK